MSFLSRNQDRIYNHGHKNHLQRYADFTTIQYVMCLGWYIMCDPYVVARFASYYDISMKEKAAYMFQYNYLNKAS